jgi:ubiquinone/menaquinone biosynthesis C-methylase UbiE
MNDEKELAYRYDLFVTPDWRDRFDTTVTEHIKLPTEGRILDVNCGTGAHAIEIGEGLRSKGEVIGVDPSAARIEIARAKAQVKKLKEATFEQSLPYDLRFESDVFDVVIGDASLMPPNEVEEVLVEMVRVAAQGGRVVFKIATHGSFGEFFSIFWEALYDVGLDGNVLIDLEGLVNERKTVSDVEQMARRAGLRRIVAFTSREEFLFETGDQFLSSPLIADLFLPGWLDIVPEERTSEISGRIEAIIERERNNGPFDLSIKAAIVAGTK